MPTSYLSIDTNAKTKKGQAYGYMTGILYFSPADKSGKNLCPHASEGCKAACLFTAGRGAQKKIQLARLRRTLAFLKDRTAFCEAIKNEVSKLIRKANKKGMIACIRLNGTSDLPWHNIGGIMQSLSTIQFYDYTPNYSRMIQFLSGELPSNYHLTFSRKENNDTECLEILKRGGNVAVVFNSLPTEWNGFPVINGDESDLRFLDEKGVVVGLKAKGKAKSDKSGFVI